MIWIVFGVLTLFVIGSLLFPFLKGTADDTSPRVDYDIVVYRDQLAEVEQDIERGLLTEVQADAARAEIHRRMLAAEDAELKLDAKPAKWGYRYARIIALIVIAIVLPLGAVIVYGALGSPQLPGKPYAWRVANDPEFIASTAADKLAAQVKDNPTIAGFQGLAETYFAAGQYDQALAADRQAISMGATDAKTWSALGEAAVMSNGGSVVPEAMQAFAKALGIDPNSERSRFYIGLAEAQIGNGKQAVAIWRDLEKDSPADAPWLTMLREQITAVSKEAKFDPATVPPSPPSMATLNAAIGAMSNAVNSQSPPSSSIASAPAAQTPGESPQDKMIQGMVAQLAAKMEKAPNDAAGWQRLAHAYNVLGEQAKAREAIDRAVRLKPEDPGIQATLAEIRKAGGTLK